MTTTAVRAELKDIQALRALFLQETNFQIRYNAYHERGWTDSYLLMHDDVRVGYGSVKGRERAHRDTVFEFFVISSFRKLSSALFRELLATSGAEWIECQSNDLRLASLLFEFSRDISASVVLFEDHAVTEHVIPGRHRSSQARRRPKLRARGGTGWRLRCRARRRCRRDEGIHAPLQRAVCRPVHGGEGGSPEAGACQPALNAIHSHGELP